LKDAQAALKPKAAMKLIPLEDLLRSNGDAFLLTQPGQTAERSKASYLTSWAVAFHLMLERRLIGTQAFDLPHGLEIRHRPEDRVREARRQRPDCLRGGVQGISDVATARWQRSEMKP